MSAIVSPVALAEIGAALGDPVRAKMLTQLLDGRALTAGELAFHGGIAAPTASGHLAKLTALGLLALQKQGRHRYYRLASPLVARMLEGVQLVAAVEGPKRHRPPGPADAQLRLARSCYDHLAGRLGVALADALVGGGHVELDGEGGRVTAAGAGFLAGFGLELETLAAGRRCFCRPCLDWSERRPHLAGALGRALAERCLQLGWIRRVKDSRAVAVTPAGRQGFVDRLGLPPATFEA
jgi:DNA-binding transcriptional ArsR family regulator